MAHAQLSLAQGQIQKAGLPEELALTSHTSSSLWNSFLG
jgi:hypothetical protein